MERKYNRKVMTAKKPIHSHNRGPNQYQNRVDVMKRTRRNITFHPLSFIKYDKLNAFYASRVILKFPFTRKSSIPSCGETQGMHLLEAWK